MALFDRFRRKSVDLNQVDNYYATPKRNNPILALLLGILTFIITLLVIWLLFMGGRWVYRQITNNDSNKEHSSQNQGNQQNENKQGENGSTSSTSTNTPSGPTNQQGQQNSSNQGSNSQGGSSAQSTPALGDTPMPRTGDEGL